MHEGWSDHPFWRQVVDPDAYPVFVIYPYLQLYCAFLFRAYIKLDSEKTKKQNQKPCSLSISDIEHDSKRIRIRKIWVCAQNLKDLQY